MKITLHKFCCTPTETEIKAESNTNIHAIIFFPENGEFLSSDICNWEQKLVSKQ